MTTRYLTTDQNGNGDQTYWDINGYFLHGPSGEKLNLGGGNTTVTASNEIVQIGTSYLRIPQGISNERPSPSYAGMIRYLTDSRVIEYYDGNLQQWLPISKPPPTLNTVSPAFFSIGTDNSFNLTGSNFGLTGASIVAIGNNGSGTIINSTVSSVLNESSALVQFDASATQNLTDISNELPFAMRITNNNSGLSSLLEYAITNANVGPIIIQPNPQIVPFQTFPVQDPSASFTLIGEDESIPTHYPFQSITITSGSAGNINDVSFVEPSGAIISVPSGQRSSHVAGTYAFNVKVVDGSSAFNNTTLSLALADPIVTSIVPSTIAPGTVDLSVNGNYFVNDSGVSYVKQSDGTVVTPSITTYNSMASLETNVFFSKSGVYDISVNNGTVFKLYTSFLTVINSLNLSGFAVSDITTTYLDSGGSPVVSPDVNGETVVTLFSTTNTTTISGSITPNFDSSSCQFLLVGGGGGGGGDNNFSGGGGAGGYRYLTGQTLAPTTYTLQIGGGGSANNNGTNTTGFSLTSGGGGAGGGSNTDSGNSGGSGGGGAGNNFKPTNNPQTNWGNANVLGTGNRGGGGNRTGSYLGDAGGGGGGAGAVGGPNNGSSGTNYGGNGLQNSITGTATYYAGGGGGRVGPNGLGNNTSGVTGTAGANGTNGLGGGGQGGANVSVPTRIGDALGGNGVIIIRFPTT